MFLIRVMLNIVQRLFALKCSLEFKNIKNLVDSSSENQANNDIGVVLNIRVC